MDIAIWMTLISIFYKSMGNDHANTQLNYYISRFYDRITQLWNKLYLVIFLTLLVYNDLAFTEWFAKPEPLKSIFRLISYHMANADKRCTYEIYIHGRITRMVSKLMFQESVRWNGNHEIQIEWCMHYRDKIVCHKRVMQFGNDLYEWRSHELFKANYTSFYLLHAILCKT